jgi:hypothetical protein
MARKSKQDLAKAKEAKQKKIAIGGAVLLVALLAIQAPKVMKMMNQKPKPPIVSATAVPPTTATPTVDPNSVAAPTLAGTPTGTPTATPAAPTDSSSSSDLVDAVPVEVDPGQLETFERFATKDPFAAQVSDTGAPVSPSGSKSDGDTKAQPATPMAPTTMKPVTTTPTTATPSSSAPPAPTPSNAVISLNGELMSVAADSDFPQSGATFNRVGAIFHLISLAQKTAKISIVGGSYASGAKAITLHVGEPLTLQNTADGTKYVLILQKQGTPAPAASTPTTTTASASSVVPSSGG